MKTKFLFFAILVQIFIVLFGLFYAQYVLNFGQKVTIKITPIDPRDLLRGNYVRLRYEIPDASCKKEGFFDVYAVLSNNGDDYNVSKLLCEKPENELYIKGKAFGHFDRYFKKYYSNPEFDIEEFYTTPKNALDIEKSISNNGENFINLRVLNGKAVIESLQSDGKIYK